MMLIVLIFIDAFIKFVSGIAFEDKEDQGIVQRAWDDLIPNRVLIYCL